MKYDQDKVLMNSAIEYGYVITLRKAQVEKVGLKKIAL